MPRRKKKKYSRPRKMYDSLRIQEENVLVKKYGLKNKREIWKADFAITKIRGIAKNLITAPEEKKNKFIEMQKARGFKVESIADVLGLDKEDYLKRRLQSIVVAKGLAKTPKQARQFIAHKHVTIKGNAVNIPSYLTNIEEENEIKLRLELPIKKELNKEEKELLAQIKKQETKNEKKSDESEE